jgi:5'-methylthioadenosine phosphorylase
VTIDSKPVRTPERAPRADIGVIGGSGLYSFLDNVTELDIETPYGPPSGAVAIGAVGGRNVAFLPRHGGGHAFPPHQIPYRANLWALHQVGVRQVLAPCAVGSLRADTPPGSVVVPDQLVDRTTGRIQTFYDKGAVHVEFADPYCPTARQVVLAVADERGAPCTDGGTMVVIDGPRFSTRAESRWYAGQGWSLINMTGHPEAVLARELAMCYAAVALVTDSDAGVEDGDSAVTQEEVFRVFGENLARLRDLLEAVVPKLPAERDCICSHALDGIDRA